MLQCVKGGALGACCSEDKGGSGGGHSVQTATAGRAKHAHMFWAQQVGKRKCKGRRPTPVAQGPARRPCAGPPGRQAEIFQLGMVVRRASKPKPSDARPPCLLARCTRRGGVEVKAHASRVRPESPSRRGAEEARGAALRLGLTRQTLMLPPHPGGTSWGRTRLE